MNNMIIYENIIKNFIKNKYNKSIINITLPIKMTEIKILEIINNNDKYKDIKIYIRNNHLVLERKNKIKNLTLDMVF